MTGETAFPEFLEALKKIAEEMSAIRANLQRLNETLEEANRLEANHPSRT